MRVKKRDGRYQEFDDRKVRRAVLGAFNDARPGKIPDISSFMTQVFNSFEGEYEVERIQDHLERCLMGEYPDVAKAFILHREHRAELRQRRLKPDPTLMSNYVHAAKYARFRPDLQRRETYEETVDRVVAMHHAKYPELKGVIDDAFKLVYEQRVLPSMRSMQFAGAAIDAHNARMFSCAYTLVDRPRVFAESFYLLLCGCGVGYSVQWQHVERLPKLRPMTRTVVHHTVADTIEGWADAVHDLILSAIRGEWIEYNYSNIRDEGSPLKTSGGRAPGHLALREAIENIRRVLLNAQGRKLRPIECNDIKCFLAEAVLSGGIRRASLICLFSVTDTEMMYAKARGVFEPGRLNAQRAMANNSAMLRRDIVSRTEFERILRIAEEGFGEPGFFFTDDTDHGTNPCGEIGMNPTITEDELHFVLTGRPKATIPLRKRTGFSFCNLGELNCAVIRSEEDFLEAADAASTICTLQAGYTDFPYLGPVTEAICKRDALLGVGLMGMVDNPVFALDPELQERAVERVVVRNREVAAMIGINPAARNTCIKPGGTAPLEVGGIGSGVHGHHARRYFRRITANPLERPAQYFAELNPHAVELKPNGDWALVFAVQAPDDAVTVKEESATEFIDRVFETYESWVKPGTTRGKLTHNVSCTVTLRPEELEEVIDKVWRNRHRVAAMAFAPWTLDKRYPFAPREAVETPEDERKWNELIRLSKPVDWSKLKETEDNTDLAGELACGGGACEL